MSGENNSKKIDWDERLGYHKDIVFGLFKSRYELFSFRKRLSMERSSRLRVFRNALYKELSRFKTFQSERLRNFKSAFELADDNSKNEISTLNDAGSALVGDQKTFIHFYNDWVKAEGLNSSKDCWSVSNRVKSAVRPSDPLTFGNKDDFSSFLKWYKDFMSSHDRVDSSLKSESEEISEEGSGESSEEGSQPDSSGEVVEEQDSSDSQRGGGFI